MEYPIATGPQIVILGDMNAQHWLKPWSPQQLTSTREAVAAGGDATGGVKGAQPPGKIAHFRLKNTLKMHL